MIEMLSKIYAKITIIVVENREPYYFIIICKYKEVPLSLFSYQMLASTFDYRWAVLWRFLISVTNTLTGIGFTGGDQNYKSLVASFHDQITLTVVQWVLS